MEEEDITPASPASDQTPHQSPNHGFNHAMLGACHFCGSEEVVDTNCRYWPPRCPALMCYADGCERPDICFCMRPDDTPRSPPHALAAEHTKRALAPSLASASQSQHATGDGPLLHPSSQQTSEAESPGAPMGAGHAMGGHYPDYTSDQPDGNADVNTGPAAADNDSRLAAPATTEHQISREPLWRFFCQHCGQEGCPSICQFSPPRCPISICPRGCPPSPPVCLCHRPPPGWYNSLEVQTEEEITEGEVVLGEPNPQHTDTADQAEPSSDQTEPHPSRT